MAANAILSDAKRDLIERHLRGETVIHERSGSVGRRPQGALVPLSFGQEQLAFIARLAPEVPVYNESLTVIRHGPVDAVALERAFNEVVRRHEAWRTTFSVEEGAARQLVQPFAPVSLPFADLSSRSPEQRDVAARRLDEDLVRRPFDLATGPLVRPLLIRLAEDEHRLCVAMHHMVFDGVALSQVFVPELIALHDAFAADRPSPLTEPLLQHGDYATWERDWVQGPEVAGELGFWRQNLAGLPVLELPADHVRPSTPSFAGHTRALSFDAAVQARLRAFCRSEGLTVHAALMAVFLVLLNRYSAQEDIVIGTIGSVRRRREFESLLGYFINTLVLRTDVSGDPAFTELARRASAVTVEALANADVPFQRLVQEIQPGRDISRNPLFQVLFSLQPRVTGLPDGWQLVRLGANTGTSKFDLSLEMEEHAGGLSGRLIASADLFDVDTVNRMADHFVRLLDGALAQPGEQVSRLMMTSREEDRRALATWNQTDRRYPRRCVHDLIGDQALLTPDRVAVVADDGALTYRQLMLRANHLAHRLRAAGVSRGSHVGVCLERSLNTVVGVLGVLQAGGAYVPLDPAFPADRLAYMLEDSGAAVLLTQTSLEGFLDPGRAQVVYVDAAGGEAAEAPGEGAGSDDLAYVLYTSGSTGKPKGVQIEHFALANLLHSMREAPGMAADDVLLAITTISFDIAGLELYLPLITGARLVLASREAVADGAILADLITTSGATILQGTPTTWRLLIEAGWQGTPGLKALCGGEALPQALAAELLPRTGELWNVYGPTETTIWSAVKLVERADVPLTIGRPIANTRIYVLDAQGRPLPVGVPGEITIGGDGVARGYLNRPELTSERFVADDLAPSPGARRYRTGDRGRYRPDGEVEFLGRLDHQVKVRGFRIEPGEIEAGLLSHPDISAAVVVADGPPGDQRLVAYMVTPGGAAIPPADLRAHLRRTLPDYMVPSAFVCLADFPTTPNGKLDRNALPEPFSQPAAPRERVAPRDAVEVRLAEIWSRVLKVPDVGVTDDFFDLGGHSLLAVRLMAEVEKAFHRRLSLAAFFGGEGTIESVAGELARGEGTAIDSPVMVTMNASGDRPPLFFLHPDEASIFSLRHFLEALGGQQPIIGLIPKRDRRRYDRGSSVAALAAGLLPLVQENQPLGPLYICGYCFGGVLAYELAHQLTQAGRDVSFLGIIDALSPAMTEVEGDWIARKMRPSARLRRLVAKGPRGAIVKAGQLVAGGARRAWGGRPGAAHTGEFDMMGTYELTIRYQPPDIDVPLTLFHNGDDGDVLGVDMGWGAVCSEKLDCIEVPGDHLTMLLQPHVQVLASTLGERLHAAQQAPGYERQATA